LLFHLAETGLLEVKNYSKEGDDPGYQLAASSLTWLAGDGKRAFHDPIRVPNQPDQGARTNPYFIEYYKKIARQSYVYKARNILRRSRMKTGRKEKISSKRQNCLFFIVPQQWNWV
jgi:hypothetical protein